jgi:hypothetical protein
MFEEKQAETGDEVIMRNIRRRNAATPPRKRSHGESTGEMLERQLTSEAKRRRPVYRTSFDRKDRQQQPLPGCSLARQSDSDLFVTIAPPDVENLKHDVSDAQSRDVTFTEGFIAFRHGISSAAPSQTECGY